MKEFKSLYDGITYRSMCPICNSTMQINNRDLSDHFPQSPWYDKNGDIYLDIAINEYPVLKIHIDDNALTFLSHKDVIIPKKYIKNSRNPNGVVTYNNSFTAISTYYQGINIECEKCCQYSFTLQILIDVTNKKMAGVFLNSEDISIDPYAKGTLDDNYYIKNIYATECTEYKHYMADGTIKSAVLPIIPLNIYKPLETLNRIKSLLIFQ